MDELENYLLFAHKLFWNVNTWHVLGGLIFYGLWTNLLVQLRNGQKLVINCYVGNRAQHCRLRLLQDCDFTGDLEDSKSTSGGILCIFGTQTFVPNSWMCKTQTSVSHSSTEAEVTSLDAGLNMDGTSALDLWDSVIEVFHSSSNQTNKTKDVREPRENLSATHQSNMRKQIPTTNTNPDLTNIDHNPSSGTHSGSNAMLYFFEDNEAVIKILIKGRSPTMRHVSRTHRVALDWLFGGINLDSKIQIRYIDTKHQFADILTKANFTRNNLLHLFNISHSTSLCCAKNFSLISCTKTMAKRMQEPREDNRIVATSKPTAMNLAITVSTSSSSVNSPVASTSPGILKASSRQIGYSGKPDVRSKRNSNPDAASSSQGWRKDALLDGRSGKPVATEKDQESLNYPETVCTWKLVAPGCEGYPGNSGTPGNSEDSETDGRIWPHHFTVSPDCAPHMEKVFSIVRQTYGRSPTIWTTSTWT